MTRLIIDPDVRAKLNNLEESLEFCDESGHILGYFTPVVDCSLYEGVEPPIGEEELQLREKETETYSTADVLKRLEEL